MRGHVLLPVAVGIIRDPECNIFLTQRSAQTAWAGYWEFPGGKIEPGETPYAALVRELYEEVGISLQQAVLWRVVTTEETVPRLQLYAFLVEAWKGTPYGREGQLHRWIAQEKLKVEEFPLANTSLVRSLQRGKSKRG